MKKILLPALIIFTLVLSACASAQGNEPTATAEAEQTATAVPAASIPTVAPQPQLVLDADNPCGAFHFIDLVLSNPYPGLPEVTAEDWTLGPDDAVVTFMEYSEPQCPYCAQLEPFMVAIQEMYPEDVRVVFRYRPFPESFHDKSILGLQAMEAAGMQGKFQEFKNWIFERQSKNPNNPATANLPDSEFWPPVAPDAFDEWLAERVPELGIDADRFLEDMFSERVVSKVQATMGEADALGINGTPTLFINGNQWPEQSRGLDIFSAYVELLKHKKVNNMACPGQVIDPAKTYSAVLATTKGDIVIKLFADTAPIAVNSFVSLAQQGWYSDMPLISAPEVLITGDPTGSGYGGPGYAFIDEPGSEYSLEDTGMVVMLGSQPDRNGSAFFINRAAITTEEDRTIFGRVSEGMDVVEALDETDRLIEITITEN